MSQPLDPTNPVVALCAQGMAMEGTPANARRCFEEAWEARRDDYDAAIAAHFLARHQATANDTLHWSLLAVQHAEAVTDGRAAEFLASLYLNLADAHHGLGQSEPATTALERGVRHLRSLPAGGYREFVAFGLGRMAQRLGVAMDVEPAD
jgi:hypothetical protein